MFEIILKVIIITFAVLVLIGYVIDKFTEHEAEGGTVAGFFFYSFCAALLWGMIISAVS